MFKQLIVAGAMLSLAPVAGAQSGLTLSVDKTPCPNGGVRTTAGCPATPTPTAPAPTRPATVQPSIPVQPVVLPPTTVLPAPAVTTPAPSVTPAPAAPATTTPTCKRGEALKSVTQNGKTVKVCVVIK